VRWRSTQRKDGCARVQCVFEPVGLLLIRQALNASVSLNIIGDHDVKETSVLEIASVVSAGFAFNPRRLKQFLNVFRLQRFIAHYTKQLLSPENPAGATPEQLGKFVAILLRWPGLLLDLLMFPTFLEDIGKVEDPGGSESHATIQGEQVAEDLM
jgi:hypothetical protein